MRAEKQYRIDRCKALIREGLSNDDIMERRGEKRGYVDRHRSAVREEDKKRNKDTLKLGGEK